MSDWWSALFDFRDYGALLALLHNSVLAGAVLGIAGGLIGVFVMTRDLAFAVHGVSELSFAGAAAGLLFGVGVVDRSWPPSSSGCSVPGRASATPSRPC